MFGQKSNFPMLSVIEFGSEIWITYTSGLGGPLQNIKTRRLTLQAS
jgi:hypothetical protein